MDGIRAAVESIESINGRLTFRLSYEPIYRALLKQIHSMRLYDEYSIGAWFVNEVAQLLRGRLHMHAMLRDTEQRAIFCEAILNLCPQVAKLSRSYRDGVVDTWSLEIQAVFARKDAAQVVLGEKLPRELVDLIFLL